MDREFWESDLQAALEEIREEVHAHMDITEDLTNKARGNTKSFLTVANGQNDCFVCLFPEFTLEGPNPPPVTSCYCFSMFDKTSSHRNTTLQQNSCMLMLVVIMVEEKQENFSFPDSNFTTTPMQQRGGEF